MTTPVDPAAEAQDGGPSPKRLSRTVIALGFVSLFTDIASEMVYTQIPIFLTMVLGAPKWVVGLIEGVAESTASLLRLVSGQISDKIGRRKPLTIAGYGLGAISKPLLFLAAGWPAVLALRFLDRVGKGLRTAPRDALIAEETPNALRGRAFGLHRAMDTTGALIGPLLGLWFLSQIPSASVGAQLRRLFLFAGLPGLLAVLTLLIFVRERRNTGPDEKTSREPRKAFRFRWSELDPVYRRFLIVTVIFNIGNSSDAFLILRASQLGYSSRMLLWIYAAFNIVEAVMGYAAGVLSDRIGRKPLIVIGYGVFALVYLGLALIDRHSSVFVWPLFLLYGVYYTLTQGTQRAFAADLADPAQRASHIGAYHTVVGLALLPASVIAGALFEVSPAAPFFVGAATAAVSAVMLARQAAPK